jgi:putative transposase
MPRRSRIDAPGALNHIIIRGIERRNIFKDVSDKDDIVNRLSVILHETRTRCYAWALMSNHVHLLLETGDEPVSTIMRRLLTGYAILFNRRHKRSGHLFQNRYKSILCQKDAYLLELVRYIHLNPLRAGIVKDMDELDCYKYSGHFAIMNNKPCAWQNSEFVLSMFSDKTARARKLYHDFVEQGVGVKRPDLASGGLKRSIASWKDISKTENMKGDERILGDSAFVNSTLRIADERLEKRTRLKMEGYNLDKLARHVEKVLGLEEGATDAKGKYSEAVKARSLFCCWAVREMGIPSVELARRLDLAPSSVCDSVRRGERLARTSGLKFNDDN